MTNKKWIIIIVIIVVTTIIQTLWKNGWFEQKLHEMSHEQYQLEDSLGNYRITLPEKPSVQRESKNFSDHLSLSIVQFTAKAPASNKIVFSEISVNCDTCSLSLKNEFVENIILESLKEKSLSLQSGIDYKVNRYNGLVFKTTTDDVPTQYFACVVNDRAYFFAQTFSGIEPNIGDRYLETLFLK